MIMGTMKRFTAYVDDSGSEPTQPLFVLGGLVLPADDWSTVTKAWNGVLAQPPSVFNFRASQVWTPYSNGGQDFAGLLDPERREKVGALVQALLIPCCPMLISCRMEWATFQAFAKDFALPKGKHNPYFYLYYGIIFLMAKMGIEKGNRSVTDFTFDQHGDIGRDVKALYSEFKRRCGPAYQQRIGVQPEFEDEKVCIPLQSADLFAWYARRHFLQTLKTDWHLGIWAWFHEFHHKMLVERDDLEHIAKVFNIPPSK